MGIYVVTGGSGGIGVKTVELLKKDGHTVINIDLEKCDIVADLSSWDGRQKALDVLHENYPDGLDGMICCAGISGSNKNLEHIISVNFFGTISLINGVYDLLLKKRGTCVITTSNTISHGNVRMDIADLLNNNNDNEQRILNLISQMERDKTINGEIVYVASKYALARWMRRHSASYAANGVRINAIAPGNVSSAMTANMSAESRLALTALPIPTKYGTDDLMEPDEVASVIVFLVSSAARGVNGIIMFIDGGTDALLNSEKVY